MNCKKEAFLERMQQTRHRLFGVIGVAVWLVGLLGLFMMSPLQTWAQALETAVPHALLRQTFQTSDAISTPSDFACRTCHGDSEQQVEFPSGETLSVLVDNQHLADSAHGLRLDSPLVCTDCHQSVNDYQFPHKPVTLVDRRAYAIDQAALCERCHQQPHFTNHPGPEAALPVTCTDCHGAHQVQTVDVWQSGAGVDACVECHQQSNVELVEPDRLTPLIRNGLFADEVDNDYCLACHSQPDLILTFPNGDTVSATIDPQAFHDSVHGVNNPRNPLNCTDCHKEYRFPHEPVPANSAREYSLSHYTQCVECHEENYEKSLDSVHGAALEEGELEAAVCTDCHGAHDTPPPDEPRQRISYTCRNCHSTVFDEYASSVHGEALFDESNPDVPTCIDCHGVHNIGDPTTNLFRVRSPQLCAECHADESLMTEYEISTDVFETYVADFHGETVTLFEQQDPTVETNKAVCYDCHGVHNIQRPDDLDNGIKANLLATCQQCHPDATANFPDAWTSHFRPSLKHNPLVYLVNLFYQIVIPFTVGLFAFLVFTDIYRRVRMRLVRGA